MEEINQRIKEEVCYETIEQLKDENLMSEYILSNSVQHEIKKLEDIMKKYINEETKTKII